MNIIKTRILYLCALLIINPTLHAKGKKNNQTIAVPINNTTDHPQAHVQPANSTATPTISSPSHPSQDSETLPDTNSIGSVDLESFAAICQQETEDLKAALERALQTPLAPTLRSRISSDEYIETLDPDAWLEENIPNDSHADEYEFITQTNCEDLSRNKVTQIIADQFGSRAADITEIAGSYAWASITAAGSYIAQYATNIWQDIVGRNDALYEELIKGTFLVHLDNNEERIATIHRLGYAIDDAQAARKWRQVCHFIRTSNEIKNDRHSLRLALQKYRESYLFLKTAAQESQDAMKNNIQALCNTLQKTQTIILQLKTAQKQIELSAQLKPLKEYDEPSNYTCFSFILNQRMSEMQRMALTSIVTEPTNACSSHNHPESHVALTSELPDEQNIAQQVPLPTPSTPSNSVLERTLLQTTRAMQVGLGKIRDKMCGYQWIYDRIKNAKKHTEKPYWQISDDAATKQRKTNMLEWALLQAIAQKKIKHLIVFVDEIASNNIPINADLMHTIQVYLDATCDRFIESLDVPIKEFAAACEHHKKDLLEMKRTRKLALSLGCQVADQDDQSDEEEYTKQAYIYTKKIPAEGKAALEKLITCTKK